MSPSVVISHYVFDDISSTQLLYHVLLESEGAIRHLGDGRSDLPMSFHRPCLQGKARPWLPSKRATGSSVFDAKRGKLLVTSRNALVTSFLLLVVMPGATSSVLAPSSDALCY